MGQDVQIAFNENGIADLVIDGSDIGNVDGLETSIATSLFSDRRADPSRVNNPIRRRGWVGDIFSISENIQIGSELWTIEQSRLNQNTINNARVFATESLAWMIDEGVADSVDVIVNQKGTRGIEILVTITRPSGETSEYDFLWRNTDANRLRRP